MVAGSTFGSKVGANVTFVFLTTMLDIDMVLKRGFCSIQDFFTYLAFSKVFTEIDFIVTLQDFNISTFNQFHHLKVNPLTRSTLSVFFSRQKCLSRCQSHSNACHESFP